MTGHSLHGYLDYTTIPRGMKMNFRNLLLFMALSLWACNQGEADNGPGVKGFPVLSHDSGQILNPSGPFLTSPAWLQDGSGIVARGRGGRGLYILRHDSQDMEIVDSAAHGFIYWIRQGDAFCMLSSGTWRLFDYDPASGRLNPSTDQNGVCASSDDPYTTIRTLYYDPDTRVDFDLYKGSLSVNAFEVESTSAWGVTVSPDGSTAAYVTGHLKKPSLFIYEKTGGKSLVDSAVHPSWHPGSGRLVYAVPTVNEQGTVTCSELFSFDLQTRISSQLTQTDDVVEMQPAFSPDGRFIAFSDWRSGTIMLISAAKEVEP